MGSICANCVERGEEGERAARQNRKAVGAGRKKDVAVQQPSPKTEKERLLIAQSLRKNENLATMMQLDDTRIDQLIDKMWKEHVPARKEIITEGDFNADYFYVVQEGKFSVAKLCGVNGASTAIEVGSENVGDSFGELALLYLVPRAATVKAIHKSVVWVIDRPSFKKILMQLSGTKVMQYIELQNRVPLLEKLSEEDKRKVAEALVERTFFAEEEIIRQGDPGYTFYLLVEGDVSIVKDGKEVTRQMASPESTPYFGERALQQNDVRAATVKVVSARATALALDRDTFDLLLGNHRMQTVSMATVQKIPKTDLKKVQLLGCGGFGMVELVAHKQTGQVYALKALSKGYIVECGQEENVLNEKQLMLMCNSPFVVKLYACYNESQHLYFLLEAARGGEIFTLYEKRSLYGSAEHAKFYAAGVILAFEHLQERHIIYRDLKPENLLLNEHGHVKLVDFGLAKCTIVQTYTTCGTPDYFAPEMIASTGHTQAVDWWTLGIIIFEWLVGHAPFAGKQQDGVPMKIFKRVRKGIGKVQFPSDCTETAQDLIKALLKENPSERLPCLTGGAQNVKNHLWYAGFDWEAVSAQTMAAPFTPNIQKPTGVGAFDASLGDKPPDCLYRPNGSNWDAGFAT